MQQKLRLAGAAALPALAACSPSGPVHDIAYYRDHPAVRAAKMHDCRIDQAARAATPDCVSALRADSEAVSKTFWTVRAPTERAVRPGSL